MPIVTAFIDDLRDVFGAEAINGIIKSGLSGVPGFWAKENGNEVGTRYHERGRAVSAAQMVIKVPQKDVKGHRP